MTKHFQVLVRELAASDLETIADDLFSHHLIDGEVYEGLKLKTKTMSQKATDVIMNVTSKVIMNPMEEFSKFLDILRKQKGMEYLVVFMEKSYRKLCILDSTCDKMISLLNLLQVLVNLYPESLDRDIYIIGESAIASDFF